MRERPFIEDKIEQFRDHPDFVAHEVLLDLNEQIVARMSELGLRNKDLADLLGVSRAYVSRLLDGRPNLTIRSLAAIALALETQLSVSLQPRAIRSWGADRANRNEYHPTQKPIALAERAISNSSLPRDRVLDLFLGSGTTMIACERLGRRCYGMEIDPRYVDVAVKRWEQFTGRKAVFDG